MVCEEVDAQGVGVRVDEACCSLDEFVVSALGEECLECGFLYAYAVTFEAAHHFRSSLVVGDVIDDEDDAAAFIRGAVFGFVIFVLHGSHLIASARARRCRRSPP